MANTLFSKIFNKLSEFAMKSNEVIEHHNDNNIQLCNRNELDKDVLDKLLNAEKDINDVYEHRFDLVEKALFASGDTVNELIEVITFQLISFITVV